MIPTVTGVEKAEEGQVAGPHLVGEAVYKGIKGVAKHFDWAWDVRLVVKLGYNFIFEASETSQSRVIPTAKKTRPLQITPKRHYSRCQKHGFPREARRSPGQRISRADHRPQF